MTSSRILFVDDDPNVLAAFQRSFRKMFAFDTASNGVEAQALMTECGPYAVIIADMQMPGMNGVELLAYAQEKAPQTLRVMLTGNADQQTAIDAVNRGAVYRFLTKPCEPEDLKAAIEQSLKLYELAMIEHELLEKTLGGSVKMLGEVLSMIDPVSFGRGQKLRESARLFGRFLKLDSTWELEIAAMLGHLGYVSIPPTIFRKFEHQIPLTARERSIVDKAPQIAHDLLINVPRLDKVAKYVLYQNKHFDGSGFPEDKLSGGLIPIGGRILKILEDRAVLEDDGIVKRQAYLEMSRRPGVYDPSLLDKCFACFESFLWNSVSAEKEVKQLKVDQLQPSNLLVSDVRTESGVLLVSAGNRLTEAMINRLKNYSEFDGLREQILVQ